MFSGFGVASAVLAVVALSVAVLISVMWSGHRAAAAERSFQARSMQAAAEWTGVLINMNADNVEENLQRLRDGTVGELNSGFDASIAPYRDVVTTLRSRTTGDVESVSIEQIHRDPVGRPAAPAVPDLATALAARTDTVLVVATSVSQNVGTTPTKGPTTVRWNLRLGVSEVDGKLMISRLESIR
jgi:hypothetical protein